MVWTESAAQQNQPCPLALGCGIPARLTPTSCWLSVLLDLCTPVLLLTACALLCFAAALPAPLAPGLCALALSGSDAACTKTFIPGKRSSACTFKECTLRAVCSCTSSGDQGSPARAAGAVRLTEPALQQAHERVHTSLCTRRCVSGRAATAVLQTAAAAAATGPPDHREQTRRRICRLVGLPASQLEKRQW